MRILLLLLWLALPEQNHSMPIQFVDVAEAAGVIVENVSGNKVKEFIVEVNGNGGAFFDYDGDGNVDLLVTNGSTLDDLAKGGSPMVALYRNRGDGRFFDVTTRAGLTKRGWAMGVCVADYDNDGGGDFYLTAYGENALFRNQGDGTFREVTAAAGVGDERYGTGCSFGDYDRDGSVDLYVANYLSFDIEPARERRATPNCQFLGVEAMCGPRHYTGETDILYRNNADGSFFVDTARAGIEGPGYYGFGVVSGDLDGDGWLDIYVANDSRPNFLLHNDGDGTFTEIALTSGVALNEEGRQEAGMGTDLGDFDNDGWLDVFVTNFSHETNTLYRGSAAGVFTDVTFSAGLGGASLAYLGWGTGLVDLDNDRWLDIFVANGHVYPEVDNHPLGTSFREAKQLFKNLGNGRYRDVSTEVGGTLLEKMPSRGVAFGDFDEDGDLDIFVVNLDERPSLLRNDGGNRNGWLRLELIGVLSNRSAVGARVTLEASGLSQLAEVRSGGSYLSHNDARIHFGLGEVREVERLEIRWPSGTRELFEALPVNRLLKIVEGRGIVHTEPRD